MTLFLMTQIHNGNRSLIQGSDLIHLRFKFSKLVNSCARFISFNFYAHIWHAYAKSLETQPWKVIVVNPI